MILCILKTEEAGEEGTVLAETNIEAEAEEITLEEMLTMKTSGRQNLLMLKLLKSGEREGRDFLRNKLTCLGLPLFFCYVGSSVSQDVKPLRMSLGIRKF